MNYYSLNGAGGKIFASAAAALAFTLIILYALDYGALAKDKHSAMDNFSSLCEKYAESDEAGKAKLLNSIEDALDALTQTEIAPLVKASPYDPPITQLILMKSALSAFHKGDFNKAQSALEKFNGVCVPNCGKKEAASEMMKKIEAINSPDASAVGVVLPLSGPYAEVGERIRQSIQMALGMLPPLKADSDAAKEKQSEGKPADAAGKADSEEKKQDDASAVELKVFFCDDKSTPEGGGDCVDELVFKNRVSAILGPVSNASSFNAAARAQFLNTPIFVFAMADGVGELGDKVFRFALSMKRQAEFMAEYAVKTLGYRKFAVIYPSNQYGVTMMNYFWDAATAAGKSLEGKPQVIFTAAETYLDGTTDYISLVRSIVERAKSKALVGEKRGFSKKKKKDDDSFTVALPDFDAVFIPDFPQQVSMILPAFAYVGVEFYTTKEGRLQTLKKRARKDGIEPRLVRFMGPASWNSQKLIDRASKYIDDALFCDGFLPSDDSPATQAFSDEYLKRFDRIPLPMDAYAFDAANYVKDALAKLAKKKSKSKEDLLNILRSGAETVGVSGKFKFDKNGEIIKDLILLSAQKGEIVKAPPPPKEETSPQTNEEN